MAPTDAAFWAGDSGLGQWLAGRTFSHWKVRARCERMDGLRPLQLGNWTEELARFEAVLFARSRTRFHLRRRDSREQSAPTSITTKVTLDTHMLYLLSNIFSRE